MVADVAKNALARRSKVLRVVFFSTVEVRARLHFGIAGRLKFPVPLLSLGATTLGLVGPGRQTTELFAKTPCVA